MVEFTPRTTVAKCWCSRAQGPEPRQCWRYRQRKTPTENLLNPESDNILLDSAIGITPTAVKPALELGANRNSFGSNIMPEGSDTAPDSQKMWRNTKGGAFDKIAQGIADAGVAMGAGRYENDITKVSPESLRYLWRTYTGGLGTFIVDSADLGKLGVTAPGDIEVEHVPIAKDSATAKAIDYSLNRWAALIHYVGDGQVPIDNNWIENRIRPIATGRKNWLFAGSLRAGKRAAAIMSLIQSAKLNGHDPFAYLKDILSRLPTQPNSRIEELLPHRWKPGTA